MRSTTTTKSTTRTKWHTMAPKTKPQREHLYQKCGSACFLLPSTRKFPVCNVWTCAVSQDALLAAERRARIWKALKPSQRKHYERVIQKAKRLRKRYSHKPNKTAGYASPSFSSSSSLSSSSCSSSSSFSS
jgi:hypothetical protein